MIVDKLVAEIQAELKAQDIDNQYFFRHVLFSINEDEELEIVYKECDEKEQFQQLVDSCIANHDPTPIPPIPTKEEVLEQELANTNAMILELAELILGGM